MKDFIKDAIAQIKTLPPAQRILALTLLGLAAVSLLAFIFNL
jgi:hypothetical protein